MPAVSIINDVIEVFENETDVMVTLVRDGDTSLPATVQLRSMQLSRENSAIGERIEAFSFNQQFCEMENINFVLMCVQPERMM